MRLRLLVAALAPLVACACATTLQFDTYEVEPAREYPTEEYFDEELERVWQEVLALLRDRGHEIEIAQRERTRVSTRWRSAPSLIHFRRRLGASGEGAQQPLPARFKLSVDLGRVGGRTRVSVVGEERTNFLILTGTDPQTGRDYYRDRWEPTSTRTLREHRFLSALGERLRRTSRTVRRPALSGTSSPPTCHGAVGGPVRPVECRSTGWYTSPSGSRCNEAHAHALPRLTVRAGPPAYHPPCLARGRG